MASGGAARAQASSAAATASKGRPIDSRPKPMPAIDSARIHRLSNRLPRK